MPIVNLTSPISALVALVLFLLTLFLSKELKRKWPMIGLLVLFIVLIISNTIDFFTLQGEEAVRTAARCIGVDFVYIFVTFIGFLWSDDIEAKARKQKSIDDSIEWLWKKV